MFRQLVTVGPNPGNRLNNINSTLIKKPEKDNLGLR